MMAIRIAATVLIAACAAACSSANQRVAHARVGTTEALVTTGNLRLVTERGRAGFPRVLCTEPSPDYAIAFGSTTRAAAALNGGAPPAEVTAAAATGAAAAAPPGSAAGGFERVTTEDVEEGAGRAAAVLALRDGLYAACQSYANGVLGYDAYAMILSQYGHLLVALVGGGRTEADEGKSVSFTAAAIDGRRATLSTLLVACVSGNDETRQVPYPTRKNPLLTPEFCRKVMSGALAQATGASR
jgi:hypothetical protein